MSFAAVRTRLRSVPPGLWLGALCFVVHLFANRQYWVFRDELYFIVCGEHFAFGYVDQPPLIPWIAAASHAVLGEALTPLRLVPALAMSATVALTADFAGRIGGGRYAQIFAGLCALLSPVMLAQGLLLSTDILQPLTWLGCAWVLAKIAKSGDERWWLMFGALVGLSALSKYLIFFYLFALAVGGLATPFRRSLTRPWIYAGAALAVLIASPSLIWQAAHGWPFLEIGQAGAHGKNVAQTPLGFFVQQIVTMGPMLAPVWALGLWRLARDSHLRALPIAYLVLSAVFIATHGKPYYLSPIYPALFAAGAVAIEAWVVAGAGRFALAALVVVAGFVSAPLALPLLEPATFLRYSRALGFAPAPMENAAQSALPQYFADMFGWQELAAEVARVFQTLPEDERAHAVFFGRNYGEAAALDVYGPAYGGPPAVSGHNNYYLWGTPPGVSVVITLGASRPRLADDFAEVELAGRVANAYAMPAETGVGVYVLRRPIKPLDEIWPLLKHYD